MLMDSSLHCHTPDLLLPKDFYAAVAGPKVILFFVDVTVLIALVALVIPIGSKLAVCISHINRGGAGGRGAYKLGTPYFRFFGTSTLSMHLFRLTSPQQ